MKLKILKMKLKKMKKNKPLLQQMSHVGQVLNRLQKAYIEWCII